MQSEFAKNDPDTAATLFLQEIIYLCTKLGKFDAIKLEHLTISDGQIGFVMLQHSHLKELLPRGLHQNIEQLMGDLRRDLRGELGFLKNTMKFTISDVNLEAVSRVGDQFFLGDWARLSLNERERPIEGLLEEMTEKIGKLGEVIIRSATPTDSINSMKVAWCSLITNIVSVYDFETQVISHKKGAEISEGVHTLVQQVPNQPYLISSNNCYYMQEASFQIVDVSRNNAEVLNVEHVDNSSVWDIACNQKTNRVALFSIAGEAAYHLLDGNNLQGPITQAKWHEGQTEWMSSLSFNNDGDQICLIDSHGLLLITDVNNNKPLYETKIGKTKAVGWTKCRWNQYNPTIAVSFDKDRLNLLDPFKQVMLFSNDYQLHNDWTTWIDWNPEGSVLASSSRDGKVNIFDPREGRIVDCFDDLHRGFIDSVRWSPCGRMLGTASSDCMVKILDLNTRKIINQWMTADRQEASSVCFLSY
jgi:WD40 repeat protein